MELKDKIVVVTGAASGIGRALVERFIKEGARRVVGVDIDRQNMLSTAKELDCVAMAADLSKEEEVLRVIEDVESQVGHIDLFCSNAGVAMAPGLDSPTSEWQLSWNINVMPHVYAARYLVPRMVARGGGYFLNTASAAGLLNQVGGAAYGVTKHAAVGFGEWLSMSYAHQGIKVSLLCPQAVRTPMIEADLKSEMADAASLDGVLEPEVLAEAVVEGLREECFLILPHPEVLSYMQRKTADYDRWLGGMNRMVQRLAEAEKR